ncbi:unnamed protein product, partial [Closterium sp. Yama58-4]
MMRQRRYLLRSDLYIIAADWRRWDCGRLPRSCRNSWTNHRTASCIADGSEDLPTRPVAFRRDVNV